MVGASYNISTVTVNCNTRTTVSSNPQLTQAIMEATVHHFAPGATAWITSQLQDAFAMPTTKFMETSTETDGLTVQLTQTLGHPNGDFSLVIQPSQLVPPTTAPPTATPPTTAPPTTAPPTTATTS
jgi:hypothetical protein